MTSAHNKKRRPRTHVAKLLEGGSFSYIADVHITGNISLRRTLVVGGNLVVDGNLKAGKIYCLGEISVKGNVKAESVFAGVAIHAGGSISASFIRTGCSISQVASLFGIGSDPIDYIDRLVHGGLIDDLEFEQRKRSPGELPSVTAGKNLTCDQIHAHSDVEVGGEFDVRIAEIGHLDAEYINVNENMFSCGCIESRTDIMALGDLFASGISCLGNLTSHGEIRAQSWIVARGYIVAADVSAEESIETRRWIAASGNIRSGGFIKAGESIVATNGITAGNDYGILAGLSTPRSKWSTSGYISAPNKPRNILTGKFVVGKTPNDLGTEERRRPSIFSK